MKSRGNCFFHGLPMDKKYLCSECYKRGWTERQYISAPSAEVPDYLRMPSIDEQVWHNLGRWVLLGFGVFVFVVWFLSYLGVA